MVEGMLDCTTDRGMVVDSKVVVEANLDVEVDYALSYSTTTKNSLASKLVQMVMHQ